MANNQRYMSLFVMLVCCLTCCSYAYNQLVVGGRDGWVLNPSENYNHWAERLRFQINDSLLFKYNNLVDSVLVVNKGDYDSCNTGNPLQKFSDGNSVFTFDRSGPFYFITGNKTNCDAGQKMIIVVVAPRNSPTVTPPSISPSSPSPATGAPSPSISPSSPSPASGGPTPSISPSSPSPASGVPSPSISPSSPSPASGGPSPSISPSSPSPASGGPSPANSPSSLSPASGGPSSANSPSSSSSSPADTPSASSTSPGSLAPGGGGSSTGNTPADGGSPPPPPGRSFAMPSCGPSGVLMLVVSIVLSVAFGGFN